jgi:hypothetical protein
MTKTQFMDGAYVDEEALGELIGQLADKADSFLTLIENNFMTAFMKVDAAKTGLQELKQELREICIQLHGGENPWEDE